MKNTSDKTFGEPYRPESPPPDTEESGSFDQMTARHEALRRAFIRMKQFLESPQSAQSRGARQEAEAVDALTRHFFDMMNQIASGVPPPVYTMLETFYQIRDRAAELKARVSSGPVGEFLEQLYVFAELVIQQMGESDRIADNQ